jgi:hypothetical protein
MESTIYREIKAGKKSKKKESGKKETREFLSATCIKWKLC